MPLVSRPNIAQAKSDIQNSGKQGVHNALRGVKQRHEAIVRPWKKSKDKPEFKTGVDREGRLLIGWVKVVGQKAEKASITVWQLLEHGTRIRFMGTSEDWVSKTQPGQLFSGPGQGHVTGINFKDPSPGIAERDFGEGVAAVQETATDEFVRNGWADGFRKGIGK